MKREGEGKEEGRKEEGEGGGEEAMSKGKILHYKCVTFSNL